MTLEQAMASLYDSKDLHSESLDTNYKSTDYQDHINEEELTNWRMSIRDLIVKPYFKLDQSVNTSLLLTTQSIYEIFLEELRAGAAVDQLRITARDVLSNNSDIKSDKLSEFLNTLHSLLYDIEDDNKRALIIQMMAELDAQMSLQVFVDEIIKNTKGRKGVEPTLSLITAITYAKNLEIRDNIRIKLIRQIMQLANDCMDIEYQNKKLFIMGSIITLGYLGKLDEVGDFIISFLKYKDFDIKEESIDTIHELWTKAAKESKQRVLLTYKERISSELLDLIHQYESHNDSTNYISPRKRLISRAYKLLAKVDPVAFSKTAGVLLVEAMDTNSDYLFTSFQQSFNAALESIKAISDRQRLDVLSSLSDVFRKTKVV